MPTKISPMTNYYIRKLYRQKDPYLSQVEDMGDDFSTFMDLEQVLKSLYSGGEIDLMVRQLETLVQYHQGLTAQSFTPQPQLKEVEQRIFSILGESPTSEQGANVPPSAPTASPPKPTVTVDALLKILNQLQESSTTFLGAAITTNYLQAARPQSDWFEQFQIQRSQPVTYAADPAQALDEQQKELAQKWIKGFVQSCSQVITKFPEIVDLPQLLGQL
ncbi:hypothetical protein ON05_008995 [Acaryochloris sp. CCMEE 5410]|nr:hypothetical protein ON05_008995 [Acaryochloris sp. CCMEE 5410]